MSPPGRPKGEYRSAQHEGAPVNRFRLRVALVLAVLAAAPAAWAQVMPMSPPATAPRAYLSVGIGGSAYEADCAYSHQCDSIGGAGRAALGLFLMPWLGLEVAAADFGKSRIGDRYGDAEFGVRMVGVGIVLPVDYGARFNGLLRLGVASVRSTLQVLPAGTAPQSSSTSAEGYYGLTMGYMLMPQLALELSLDGTRGYVGQVGGRVDALTVGLSLRF